MSQPQGPIERMIRRLERDKNTVRTLRDDADKASRFLDDIDKTVKHFPDARLTLRYTTFDDRDPDEQYPREAYIPLTPESAAMLRNFVTAERDKLVARADQIEAQYDDPKGD